MTHTEPHTEPWTVEGHGLVLPAAQARTPTRARVAARNWLLAHQVDAWTAESETEAAHAARAWWNDKLGFVQEDAEVDAEHVVVVALPAYVLRQVGGASGVNGP